MISEVDEKISGTRPGDSTGSSASAAQKVRGVLLNLGWRTVAVEGGWRLEHSGPDKTQLYANVSQNWFDLSMPLESSLISDPRERFLAYQKLLGLNERALFLAKFALDDDDRLLLMTQIPLADSSPQFIKLAVESLATYGPRYQTLSQRNEAALAKPDRKPPVAGREPKRPTMSADIFADFIRSAALEGWGTDAQPQEQTWLLKHRGRLRIYEAYLSLTESWAAFQVPVLIGDKAAALRLDYSVRALFLRYLLRLNDQLYMVKFGVDEDGRVLLLLELPCQELNYNLFRFAVRTIGKYLERYSQELEILALPERDKHILALLTQAESAKYTVQKE